MVSIKRLARDYRGHGFNLLPTRADKTPTLPSWGEWARRQQTSDDLNAMNWNGAAGVAAIGGPVSGDLYCLDFDGVTRDDLLGKVLIHLGLPEDYPWSVRTPGGGLHVWVICHDFGVLFGDSGKVTGHIEGCGHVELRGRGHYSVLPGSQHPSGGIYAFMHGEADSVPMDPPVGIAACRLKGLADWGEPEQAPRAILSSAIPLPEHSSYLAAAIAGEVQELATAIEGQRNNQLNNSALALGSLPLSLADVIAALLPVAIQVGLGERESLRTIESGYRAGRRNPRQLPDCEDGPAIVWGKTQFEQNPDEADSSRLAIVRTLSTIEPEEVRWVWPGRLALGKLTLLAGDPGLGKSFMTLDIAARISHGTTWPDGSAALTGDVLLLTAEDGIADTVVPRLLRMNADMNRVHVLESVIDPRNKHERLFQVQTDVQQLEEAIQRVHPLLVVVDPLSAYLRGVDTHRTADVRGALAPLMTLAERTGVCLLCTSHLSKAETRSALYRVTGSLDFVAAARAAFLVAEDPNDEARRVVLTLKMNIAEKPPGIAFSITEGAVLWDNEPVTVDLASVLNPDHEVRSRLDDAKSFLEEILTDGPMAQTEIVERAKHEGISIRTLRRAKERLAVESVKRGIIDGWYWFLPSGAAPALQGSQPPANNRLDTFEAAQVGRVGSIQTLPFPGLEGHGRLHRHGEPSCIHEAHRQFWRVPPNGTWRCAICRPTVQSAGIEWLDIDLSPIE